MGLLLLLHVDEEAFLGAEKVEVEEFVKIRAQRFEAVGIKRDVVAACHGGIPFMK
jgi:hypothetical protein